MKRYRIPALLRQFIIPYITILVFSFISGIILYSTSTIILQQAWRKHLDQRINDAARNCENSIDSLENALMGFTSTLIPRMTKIDDPFSQDSIMRVWDLRNELKTLTFSNDVYDYYLLFRDNGLAVNATQAYRMDNLFRERIICEGFTFEQLQERLFSSEPQFRNVLPLYKIRVHSDISLGDTQKNVLAIAYRQSAHKQSDCVLLVFFDADALLQDFNSLIAGHGLFAIYDVMEENIIYSNGEAPLADLTDYDASRSLYVATAGELTGWQYMMLYSKDHLFAPLQPYKYAAYSVLAVYLAIGVVVVTIIMKRLYHPFHTLSVRLHRDNTGVQGIPQIVNKVDSLLTDYDQMRADMLQLQPMLRQMFIQRLLHMPNLNVNALSHLGMSIGIDISGAAYVVVMVHYQDSSQTDCSDMLLAYLSRIDRAHIGCLLFTSPISEERTALVLVYPNSRNADGEYERDLEMICHEIPDNALVFASHPIFDPLNVRSEYKRIIRQFEHGIWTGSVGLVLEDEHDDLPECNYHDLKDTLRKTQNLVIAGSISELDSAERFLTYSLSAAIQQYDKFMILIHIWTTYEECTQMLNTPVNKRIIQQILQEQNDPEAMMRGLKQIMCELRALCRQSRQTCDPQSMQDLTCMLDYVQEHCSSAAFGLEQLAAYMRMSPAQCSQAFKRVDSRGFFKYMEEVRISRAMELLNSSGRKIEDIAAQVGYNSIASFSRAFKRYVGVSPTVFRKTHPDS